MNALLDATMSLKIKAIPVNFTFQVVTPTFD